MNKNVKEMILNRVCSCAWCKNRTKQLDEDGLRYDCPYHLLPVWAHQTCGEFEADEDMYNRVRSANYEKKNIS